MVLVPASLPSAYRVEFHFGKTWSDGQAILEGLTALRTFGIWVVWNIRKLRPQPVGADFVSTVVSKFTCRLLGDRVYFHIGKNWSGGKATPEWLTALRTRRFWVVWNIRKLRPQPVGADIVGTGVSKFTFRLLGDRV